MKAKLPQKDYGTCKRNVQLLIDESFAEKVIPADDSVRLLNQMVEEMDLRQHRTISSAALCGNFPPAFRCIALQYTKYCCANAPHSEAKFTRKSLLPNYAVLP